MDHAGAVCLRPDLPAAGDTTGTGSQGSGGPSDQWVDHAAFPGAGRLRDLDRTAGAGGRHASRARTRGGRGVELVNHVLVALGWAVVGGVLGAGLNYLSRWLARIEEIEFRQSLPEMLLMPALSALLFFLFALQLG